MTTLDLAPSRPVARRRLRRPVIGLRRRRVPDVGLLAVPPFDAYPPDQLRPLARHVDRLRPAAGTTVVQAGHRVDEVVLVLAGSVTGSGVTLGPGALIGAAELLSAERHARTLLAGDGLEILVIYGPAFRCAARTLPNFVL